MGSSFSLLEVDGYGWIFSVPSLALKGVIVSSIRFMESLSRIGCQWILGLVSVLSSIGPF